MKIITELSAIQMLPHSSGVKNALLSELTKPFGSIDATSEFWHSTSTSLVAVLPDESDDCLLDEHRDLLEAFRFNEFITPLVEGWSLALVITSQEGGGRYLLFSWEQHSKLTTLLFT